MSQNQYARPLFCLNVQSEQKVLLADHSSTMPSPSLSTPSQISIDSAPVELASPSSPVAVPVSFPVLDMLALEPAVIAAVAETLTGPVELAVVVGSSDVGPDASTDEVAGPPVLPLVVPLGSTHCPATPPPAASP